eukprot:CAMPEP_0116074320 /NCGR_PEP_ID=MMETSP0322-20121206/15857_1 /TAXON_ID=163516 /ORGANISM="Leptocylindrus danicus var. apora, Strain B651" /LENGTH=701 /DNA_ID=CAMNT_0003563941 /DNA_START=135 /DNA_END=2240 /DNA_ORIENTATION=-
MDDTIQRMLGTATSSHNKTTDYEQPTFIPSKIWQGVKSGYYFGTTDASLGTGYYLDSNTNPSKKRVNDGNGSANGNIKRAKLENDSNLAPEELLARAEKEAARKQQSRDYGGSKKPIALTPSGIKAAAGHLAKLIEQNQILRSDHADDPVQFMESELALNEEIGAFKVIGAADASLYGSLSKLQVDDSILSLLAHDNADIAISTLDMLVEIVDLDDLSSSLNNGDASRAALNFVFDLFVKKGGLELIVANLGRICFSQSSSNDNEATDEERLDAGDHVLSLVETLLDLDQMGVLNSSKNASIDDTNESNDDSVAVRLVDNTNLVSWLFDRMNRKSTDIAGGVSAFALKLHAAEILSTLLHVGDSRLHLSNIECLPTFEKIGNIAAALDKKKRAIDGKSSHKTKQKFIDGIEILLQAIAPYRKKDPKGEDECEWLSAMFSSKNIETFLNAQGIELMLRCIREKVHSGSGSLKVLFYVLSGNDIINKKACEVFVEVGGFKNIFSCFMGKSSAIPKPAKCTDAGKISTGKSAKSAKRIVQAKKEWLQTIESNILQIVYALTVHIDEDSPFDAKMRLLAKFVEDDFSKCDRIIELFVKYDKKMRTAELKYYRSEEAEEAEIAGLDVGLAACDAKLRGGGDVFHRIAASLAYIILNSKDCFDHISVQLKMQGLGISVIGSTLEEFVEVLDDSKQRAQLQALAEQIL